MRSLQTYFLAVIAILFVSCSQETPKNLTKKVNHLISEDHYEKALNLLNESDSSKTDANLKMLKEKTHLNYGIYMEHRGPDKSSMHDRMTTALRQYIEVLKINPKNQKAKKEIKQIMGIYKTMPSNSPGKDIVNELNKLGFNY